MVFIMNEFFRKWHYEYLLEQMCEIGLRIEGKPGVIGNSQERKTAPISRGKERTLIYGMLGINGIGG